MASPVVFNWLAPDTQAVCATQTLAGAGNLTLNGTLSGTGFNPIVTFEGISRVVSITSTNNLSAVSFTIAGTYRGATVSATRVGPNNTTVQTTQLFDSVTSVSTNAAAAAVSIGTGTTGRTHWLSADYFQQFPYKTIQTVVAGTINYTFQVTLDDIQTTATPSTFTPIANLTGATTNQFEIALLPISYSSFLINSSGATGALTATVLQQGVK
jgi:hypothetical protein